MINIAENPDSIVFVGTLDYGPCETAVSYFVQEILPLLKKKIPHVRFIAVGKNPSNHLKMLAQKKKIFY